MPAGRRVRRPSVAIEVCGIATFSCRTKSKQHADLEPLTRSDLQFDLLSHIFADETKVFSDPASGPDKLSFRDVFINAILRSPKAKSVLKEKLALSAFATDFCKLALLVNVNRLPATMSCMSTQRLVFHGNNTSMFVQFLRKCGPRRGHTIRYLLCSVRMGTCWIHQG
jgi:hypothetical protein